LCLLLDFKYISKKERPRLVKVEAIEASSKAVPIVVILKIVIFYITLIPAHHIDGVMGFAVDTTTLGISEALPLDLPF
jgi:hypothetical protein